MSGFDQPALLAQLSALSRRARVLFAAACAERQMHAHSKFLGGDGANELAKALSEVWASPDAPTDPGEMEARIERLTNIIPAEETATGGWTQDLTIAQHAAMAVVYALRAKLSGEAQEAAWAALTAFEALDCFVINRDQIDVANEESYSRVLDDPLIRAELMRQSADLRELQSDTESAVRRVRDRARADSCVFLGGCAE